MLTGAHPTAPPRPAAPDPCCAGYAPVELTRGAGPPSSVDLVVAGDAMGGLPHAEHTSIAGILAEQEPWMLRVPPVAIATLPAPLRRVATVEGEVVARLEVYRR